MLGTAITMTGCNNVFPGGQQTNHLPLRLEADGWLKQPSREIPGIAEADLVVPGGGPSGVAAAVNAARMGVKVILLERYSYLGCLWTGGLVLPTLSTHGLSPDKEWTKVVWGISHEIHERLKGMNMVVK